MTQECLHVLTIAWQRFGCFQLYQVGSAAAPTSTAGTLADRCLKMFLIWRHTVTQKRMCAKVPFRSDERPLVRPAPQLICPMSQGCCFVFQLNRGRSRSERLQRFTKSVWLTLFFLGTRFSCKFAPELYQASCVMLMQKYMQSTLTLCAGTSSTDTRFLPPWKLATRLAKKFRG